MDTTPIQQSMSGTDSENVFDPDTSELVGEKQQEQQQQQQQQQKPPGDDDFSWMTAYSVGEIGTGKTATTAAPLNTESKVPVTQQQQQQKQRRSESKIPAPPPQLVQKQRAKSNASKGGKESKIGGGGKPKPLRQRTKDVIKLAPNDIPVFDELAQADDAVRLIDVLNATKKVFKRRLVAYKDKSFVQTQFTRSMAIAKWGLNAHYKDWNVPVGNMNASDELFVTVCYDHVCRNRTEKYPAMKYTNVIETKVNMQKTLRAVQALGTSWRRSFDYLDPAVSAVLDGKWVQDEHSIDTAVEMLFDICAGVVVFGFAGLGVPKMLAVADAKYDFVRNPFKNSASNFGSEQELATKTNSDRTGNSNEFISQGGQGMSEAEHVAYLRKENAIMRECAISEDVHSFIPWCTRIFFSIWFDQTNVFRRFASISSQTLRAAAEKDYKQWKFNKTTLASAFSVWMDEQVSMKPTEAFVAPFRDFCYGMMLPPGAALFSRRSQFASSDVRAKVDLFHSDINSESECRGMQNSLDVGIREIWKDPTHPHHQNLIFFMFAHIFKFTFYKSATETLDFRVEYCIFDDEMQQRVHELVAPTRLSRPKRPIIVQSHGGLHVMYNNLLYVQETVMDTLLLWMVIIRRDFDGSLEDGRLIDKRFIEPIIGRVEVELDNEDAADGEGEAVVAEEEEEKSTNSVVDMDESDV